MNESLGNNEMSPEEEINFLQRLQTEGKMGDREWDRDQDFPRLQQLLEERGGGEMTENLSEEEVRVFSELSRKRDWGEQLTAEETAELERMEKIRQKQIKPGF